MANFEALKATVDFRDVENAREAFKGLREEIPGAGSAVEIFKSLVESLETPLVGLAAGLAAAASGAVALGFKAIELADRLGDMSVRTGRSVEDLQVLGAVAEKSGTNLETLMDALDGVAKKSTAGAEEGKKVGAAYSYLGISARDANGNLKDAKTLGEEGANALQSMGHSANATAAFIDAFGSAALKVVPTLVDLNEETAHQQELMQSLGAVMDEQTASAAKNYADKLKDVGTVFKAVGNSAATDLVPGLYSLADGFVKSAQSGGLVSFAMKAVEDVVWLLGKAIQALAVGVIATDVIFKDFFALLGAGFNSVNALLHGDVEKSKLIWKEYGEYVVKVKEDAAKQLADLGNLPVKDAPKTPGKDRGKYNPFNTSGPVAEKEDPGLAYLESLKKQEGSLEHLNVLEMANIELQKTKYANSKYRDEIQAQAEYNLGLERGNDLLKQLNNLDALGDKRLASLQDEINKRHMTAEEIAQNNFELAVQLKLEQDIAELKSKGTYTEGGEAAIRAKAAALIQSSKDKQAENEADKKAQNTFANGWEKAFKSYQDAAADAAKVGADAFKIGIDSMSGALSHFVMTGKLDFKSLALSIISSLIQIEAQREATQIFGFIGGLFGGSPAAGAASSIVGGSGMTAPIGFKLATGTNYVPYDGMPAVLHEGEAVVPKQYNPAANGGSSSSGGTTINVGGISVTVKGGTTNSETGNAVSSAVMKAIQQVADSRILNAKRPGGALY
jgi:lambda family phage tail tape measure protein